MWVNYTINLLRGLYHKTMSGGQRSLPPGVAGQGLAELAEISMQCPQGAVAALPSSDVSQVQACLS